jgi:leader peptidase (prepilin peptidase)/N-methyltransferase
MNAAVLGPLLKAYVFVAGACVGSFLNVVIARLPAGHSLVRPRSRCPRCGAPIAWYDNIPLVSWVLLRGRCRNCKEPISVRYPLVELLTAVVCLAVFTQFGLRWAALGYAVFACALIALSYIDLDTWLLPHEITWPLLALGLASPLWNPALRPLESIIGAAAGFAFFAGLALFGEKVLRKETMGWGDVWLLSAIGAWLGWKSLLPVVLLAAVQGTIVGTVLLLRKPKEPAASAPVKPAAEVAGGESDDDWVPPPHAVPFGPFLTLAALQQLLFGAWLIDAYFGLLERLWQ